MDFFQSHQTVCCVASSFFHFPERSIALVKRLAGSPKELKLIRTCPTLTKVFQGSTRILIYIDGLFQSHQTVPKLLSLTFFHFPERSIALVKRLAGSPKELKLIQTAPR
jgi:hypothetical protein